LTISETLLEEIGALLGPIRAECDAEALARGLKAIDEHPASPALKAMLVHIAVKGILGRMKGSL